MSTIFFLVVLVAAVWAIANWRAYAAEARWLPTELREATLVYSEHTFVTTRPFLLGAIVDRVYRRPDGVLVLLEFKRRDQALPYQADVVELSAQRLALAGATRERVADYGYVAVANATGMPGPAMRVSLLSPSRLAEIRDRYVRLTRGEVQPTPTNHAGLCVLCPYRSACHAGDDQ